MELTAVMIDSNFRRVLPSPARRILSSTPVATFPYCCVAAARTVGNYVPHLPVMTLPHSPRHRHSIVVATEDWSAWLRRRHPQRRARPSIERRGGLHHLGRPPCGWLSLLGRLTLRQESEAMNGGPWSVRGSTSGWMPPWIRHSWRPCQWQSDWAANGPSQRWESQ